MDATPLPPFPDAPPATQRTLRNAIECVGVGLHSGRKVRLALRPAPSGHGIVFRRTDLGRDLAARFDHVADTRLCTVLADPAQASARVGTVEHVMAALSASGIDNAVIDVDGPELPILDGSAAPFVFLIECAGVVGLPEPRPVIEVLRTVRVQAADGGFAEIAPLSDGGTEFSAEIDFADPAIGREVRDFRLTPARFRTDIAPARTFTLLAEVEAARAAGLARGGSLDNAIVVDAGRVLNPTGLRMRDEFVRHKLLDMVGDLALAGGVLRARITASRPGHALNNRLLRALFADRTAWRRTGGVAPGSAWSAKLPAAAAPSRI